jgi:hypothetical protein
VTSSFKKNLKPIGICEYQNKGGLMVTGKETISVRKRVRETGLRLFAKGPCLMVKTLWIVAIVLLLTFALASQGRAQRTLMTESFETASVGQTPPTGWDVDLVSGSNYTYFRSSGTHPTTTPYDGARMVEFDSWTAVAGTANRLRRTTAISTIGYAGVAINFAWYEDGQYTNADRVDVQWSTDGTTWNTAGTFYRYNAAAGWKIKSVSLPAAAEGQAALYIAFLFTSAYGNSCHLDLVHVTAVRASAQTNLIVVRHNDNTLWKMTCSGTSNCSSWTKITGKFSVQPTLAWDPAIQKYILIGIGNDKTSIWRGTFEADGTWNNDWTQITGASPSPVAMAARSTGPVRDYSLLAETMQPIDSSVRYDNSEALLTTTQNSSGLETGYIGQLSLPDGARIVSVKGLGIDTDPTSEFIFRLYRYKLGDDPVFSTVTDSAFSGVGFSGGKLEANSGFYVLT